MEGRLTTTSRPAIIAVGTVLTGPVTDTFGWRGLFMVPLVLTRVGNSIGVAIIAAVITASMTASGELSEAG